ncbi:DUF6054 family protein [Paenibacillus sp. J22TS3]|uniref:DUF6054 family protein n=1 Tax=Paenibacillus sp. J22TS3 TaxID=2807192 RepID=UPI001BCF8D1E|nr:DUF6054 family protein [Paenibacillus sp. J22TS3]
MSESRFKVSLTPGQVRQYVKDGLDANLVHEEFHDLGDGREIGTLIFEKYFFRVKNRVALVVIADNIYGTTEVRAISTGSSEGMVFAFDWGASKDFAGSVQLILSSYIVGD